MKPAVLLAFGDGHKSMVARRPLGATQHVQWQYGHCILAPYLPHVASTSGGYIYPRQMASYLWPRNQRLWVFKSDVKSFSEAAITDLRRLDGTHHRQLLSPLIDLHTIISGHGT